MPNVPLDIKIDWGGNPPGQVGTRPAVIHLHGEVRFTSDDPGFTGIEFKDHSPLTDGSKRIAPGSVITAAVPGRFKFKCHRQEPGGPDQVLDPDDPNLPGGGGELEVIPE